MQQIYVNEIHEDPTSGLKTWKITYNGVQVLKRWFKSQGLDMAETIRGYEKGDHGSIMFNTGSGYAVFDADLLGGNGDGLTERRFNDETGFYFRRR